MSKGAIRVAVCLETSKTIEDHKERLDEYCSCEATYVLKRDILGVERFDSWSAMHAYFHHGGWQLPKLRKQTTIYSFLKCLYTVLDLKCCCNASVAHKSFSGSSRRLWERANDAAKCLCDFPIYPLYLVITKNKYRKHWVRQTKDDDYYQTTAPIMLYIVHPDEREHMERFLAGTDDALYDYVHHLKYDPLHGTEVKAAKEEYEAQAKKQKRGGE